MEVASNTTSPESGNMPASTLGNIVRDWNGLLGIFGDIQSFEPSSHESWDQPRPSESPRPGNESDAKSRHNKDPKPSQLLACPYNKLDGRQHRDCTRYKMKRMKDVKQHIQRRHTQPATSNHFNQNMPDNGWGCKDEPLAAFDGILEQHKKDLRKCINRGKSAQIQWYTMWDILFPKRQRPASIYIDDCSLRPTCLMRKIWNDRKSIMMAEALVQKKKGVHPELLFDRVMRSLFDQIDNAMATANGDDASLDTSTQSADATPSVAGPEPPRERIAGTKLEECIHIDPFMNLQAHNDVNSLGFSFGYPYDSHTFGSFNQLPQEGEILDSCLDPKVPAPPSVEHWCV
ncbi:hypothetical protein B0T25DRAFT_220877 [Lasiosphaeria hispida]|uniref:Uncharacterized protein n=1 Tax=Lasiosphaeria hispida TaxID=260671 RepID=A0AAJ0HK01_9PEZI|nr:hypothetical protein B0T25DRAFT_220877 [Lasiosphaeria hispida]